MKINKYLTIGILFMLLLSTITLTTVNADEQDTTLNYTLNFSEIKISPITLYGEKFLDISVDDLIPSGKEGQPAIPYKSFSYVIPVNKVFESVSITPKNGETIKLSYPIMPNQPMYPFSNMPRNTNLKYDIKYYNQKNTNKLFNSHDIQNCRGYKLLCIELSPIEYTTNSNKIIFYNEIDITINLKNAYQTQSSFLRNNKNDKDYIKTVVENTDIFSKDGYNTQYETQDYTGGLCNPLDTYEYVIITSEELNETSGYLYNWSDLLSYRESHDGLNCTKISVADITACEDYWNDTALYNDTQAHIREFCKDAYQDWDTEYILLGGDWDYYEQHVPYRSFFCGYDQPAGYYPCDLYYSNLDGNWRYGDVWGGKTSGGDAYSELYSGRITVQNGEDISNFIEKIMWYENDAGNEFLNRTAFVGSYLGWGITSAEYMEDIRNGTGQYIKSTEGFTDWNDNNPTNTLNISERQYWDWGASIPTDTINLINNNLVCIINHLAHGGPFGSLSMVGEKIRNLVNTKPLFFYTQECSSGDYAFANVTTEHMWIVETNDSRAFASVQNTGYGWGSAASTAGSNQYKQREFWDYIFTNSTDDWQLGKAIASANNEIGEYCTTITRSSWWYGAWYGAHLFGDPALTLRFKNGSIIDDLAVNIISISDNQNYETHITPNHEYNTTISVHNYGDINKTNIDLKLYVNDILENSTTISYLNTSEFIEVNLNFTSSSEIPSDGIVTLTANISGFGGDNISDNNENQLVLIIGPDLEASNLNVGFCDKIYINRNNYLNATITNKGDTNLSSQTEIGLYINDTLKDTTNITYLNITEESDVSFEFYPSDDEYTVDDYNIKIEIGTMASENYTKNQNISSYVPFDTEINSSVDTIIPYNIETSPKTITATANESYDNVTLYYRHSLDNQTWGAYLIPSIFNNSYIYNHTKSSVSENLITNSKRQLTRNLSGDFWFSLTDSDKNLTVCYTNGSIWSNISIDLTGMFPEGVKDTDYSTLAVDSNDVVHIVFVCENGSTPTYHLLYTNTTNLSNVVSIFDGDLMVDIQHPSVAIDSNDNIHVAFRYNFEICYINSTDSGDSWSSIQEITVDSNPYYISMAINSSDSVHIVFMDSGYIGIYNQIRHVYSDDWISWTEENVTEREIENFNPCLAIDSNDYLHVVFYTPSYNDVQYSVKNETEWSEITNITSETIQIINPSISITTDDYIYVLFTNSSDIPDGPVGYIYSTDAGTSWSNVEWITPDNNEYAHTAWSYYPVVDGNKINMPKIGCSFIFSDTDNTSFRFMNLSGTTYPSSEGQEWTEWNNINNPDNASPWQWDFNFPNNNGYYEFYSIAKHLDETEETLNESDAICYYTQSGCPCSLNSYDYGNWSFSEHIINGTLEEDWCECNETLWETYTLYSDDAEYNIVDGEGDGVAEGLGMMFIGDNIGDTLVHSEFKFTPNVTGNLYGFNIHVNHTVNTGGHPSDFDIYIDSGDVDRTIDGTKVKDAWNPSWSVGWKQIYFDTNFTVTAGETYEIQFETMETDSEDDFDRLYIGYDGSPSSTYMTVYGGASWDNYSYIGDIIFNITSEDYAYSFNGSMGTVLGYTHLNNSGCNRTQSLVWTQYNITDGEEGDEVYPGVIFDWHNCSDWTGVFYKDAGAFVLHWNGTSLIDAPTGVPVNDENDATDFYRWGWGWLNGQDYYEVDIDWEGGCWIKTIYNTYCGRLWSKIWGDPFVATGLEYEPAGWLVNETFDALKSSNPTCYGLAYWNPSGFSFRGLFNYIQHWQLNYSLNESSSWDLSEARPNMKFPIIDMMDPDVRDNAFTWYNGTLGNFSDDSMRTIMKNITNLFNVESRFYQPNTIELYDQNDTVYYHSAILSNFSTWYDAYYDEEIENQTLAHNELAIWIEDCTDGRDTLGIDSTFVGINVDDDNTWDNNDRAFYWDLDWNGIFGTGWQWNGSTWIDDWTIFALAWNSSSESLRNVHRYNSHINYLILIPLDQLLNETGQPLNTTDTFGLCIGTYNGDDSNSCYWQNWNETLCDTFVSEDHDTAKQFFLNCTFLSDSDLNINSTNLGRWGQGEIESGTLATYTPQDCNISVTKTVWNGSAWATTYDAYDGETLLFNITITNEGNVSRNLTIRDNHYDAIKILENATIKYPNGTSKELTAYQATWEDGECSYDPHGHIEWRESAENLSDGGFDHGEKIYIYINMTTVSVNYSENNVAVYLCDFEYEWWDSTCNDNDTIYINQPFNEDITCYIDVSENSSWAISEHIHRSCQDGECYDEEWHEYETNYSIWAPYNTSWFDTGIYDWEWVYRYDNDDGSAGDSLNLSYTIANYSCANRSMSYLRMRYNISDDQYEPGIADEPCIGIIYSFHDNSWYNMILYSYQSVYLLSKMGESLYNTETATPVTEQSDAINYFDPSWTQNTSMIPMYLEPGAYGIWVKTIFNSLCNILQTKAWQITDDDPFGLEEEPPGWIYDENIDMREENYSCFGLVVWSNTSYNFTADFDFIEDFRLNYSRDSQANASQLENHSVYGNDGIPLMTFPVYDKDVYMDDYYYWIDNYYNEYFIGNLSSQEFADYSTCLFQNISDNMSMESRAFIINESVEEGGPESTEDYNNQNDTIYYYTSVFTNMSQYEYPFNNSLYIQVEDCTDGTQDDYDGLVVCVDVDNNMEWNDNDIAVYMQRVWNMGMWDTRTIVYNGTTEKYNVFESEEFADNIETYLIYEDGPVNWFTDYFSYLPMLHRFSNHSLYALNIPLYHFEKGSVGSGNYLDANDTFGLHVMTIDDDSAYCAVWENWNESSCSNYTINDNNGSGIWNIYMNCSDWGEQIDFEDGIWNGVDSTHMQYWGHGRIGNNFGPLDYTVYSINLTKTSNISSIQNIDTNSTLNYTIMICNDGDTTVTNITVNDTIPSCMSLIDCSLDSANYYNPGDNHWIFNITDSLDPTNCVSINITVNVSGSCAPNGTVMMNHANASTNESATAYGNCSVIYGSNRAPIITDHNPFTNRTILNVTLLLENINVTIEDPNGDTMDLYLFTNKSNGYADGWYPIGTNTSVNNGTYNCNQTFNYSLEYNTKWRWGNTIYYFFANVTDGLVWTNETLSFLTAHSRYNMNAGIGAGLNDEVDIQDALFSWNHRASESSYYGIYDVAGGNDEVDIQDALTIWSNRDT